MRPDLVKLLFSAFDPFMVNVPILHPLKTPGNLWFYGVFRGYKIRKFAINELIETVACKIHLRWVFACVLFFFSYSLSPTVSTAKFFCMAVPIIAFQVETVMMRKLLFSVLLFPQPILQKDNNFFHNKFFYTH